MRLEYRETYAAGAILWMTVERAAELDAAIKAFQRVKSELGYHNVALPSPPVGLSHPGSGGTTAAPLAGVAFFGNDAPAAPAATALAPASTQHDGPALTVAAPQPSEGDVITAFRAFVKTHALPDVTKLFEKFGVTRASEVSAEQRADFIAATQA